MHRLKLLIFAIGIILSGLAYAEDEDEDIERSKRGMVLVEPGLVTTSETKEEYELLPYKERRGKWGTTFSLGYSSYEPLNYEPDFVAVEFSEIYKTPDMPLIELQFTFKRNMSLGSLGVLIAAGMYQNESDNTELSDSSLELIPVRLGAVFALDTLGRAPWIVPYFGGGGYIMLFSEDLAGGNSKKGNTQVAPYFHGGVALSLDWIDRVGARQAFQESGIQSTFAFFEVQSFGASSAEADADFSTDLNYAGGIKVEF